MLQIFRLNSPRLINWLISAAQVDKGTETVGRCKTSLGFPGMKEFTCRWEIIREKSPLWGEERSEEAAAEGEETSEGKAGRVRPEERHGGLHRQ